MVNVTDVEQTQCDLIEIQCNNIGKDQEETQVLKAAGSI